MDVMNIFLVLIFGSHCHIEQGRFDESEDKIVKAIEALHGAVTYEDEAKKKKIIEVDFSKDISPVKDQDLSMLAKMKDLKSLFVCSKTITGKGLIDLEAFADLEQLELNTSGVDDEVMKWVAKNKSLKNLGLGYTKVTDKGLEHLSQLKNLEFLVLSGTKVSDAGLVHLKGMKNLELLFLPEIKKDGKGLIALKQALPNLITK